MAAYTELTLEQGATFGVTVDIIDDEGDALNLASYTASSQMRKSYYSSSAIDFLATISDSSNGKITLSMTAANTANVKAGRYLYDLVIEDQSNTKLRVVEGIVIVLPSVTR